jgi:hypothetical protein
MDWLMDWPSLAKLGAILAVMLVMVRLKINVGWALILGSVLCGLWFRQDLMDMGESVSAAATDPGYCALVGVIMLILILNHTLQQSGQIKRIVEAFSRVCRRPRTTLVFFPALLGLLPMPGGALFSAPMVETTGAPLGLQPEDKTLINYWFRHIWEYSWPLYPGIILSAGMSGYSIAQISLYQLPMVVAVSLAGYVFYIRGLKMTAPATSGALAGQADGSVGAFLREITPIWLVILLFAVLKTAHALAVSADLVPEAGRAGGWLKQAPMVVAIVLTVIYAVCRNRMGLKALGRLLWQKDMYDNLVIAICIIVFAGIFKGSGAADRVAEELAASSIPLVLVAMVLPFTVGAVTGITMNMVALTYPVILASVGDAAAKDEAMGYMVLAFACGYGGILLTPIHICMVQSNEYFKLNATATVHRLAWPTVVLMLTGLLLFWLYTGPLAAWGLMPDRVPPGV